MILNIWAGRSIVLDATLENSEIHVKCVACKMCCSCDVETLKRRVSVMCEKGMRQ